MNVRSLVEAGYEKFLVKHISYVPNHIAVIQDGNRRYARLSGMGTALGHRAGAGTTEKLLEWSRDLGIRHITLYSFSTENFSRDMEEVESLFALFKEMFQRVLEDERTHAYKMRVRMVGDRTLLPPDFLECIREVEEATAAYGNFFVNVALAYGGRNEIVHAARSILQAVRQGSLAPEAIDMGVVEAHLHNGMNLPPVDLIIRTGDEKRTSNFLPWSANGNESAVYFCAPYWPVFRKLDLLRAIRVYDQRMKLNAYVPKRRIRN
ncbi:MAG TPA: di-trans,poly-cis-decaprenylcistransferase [Methanoculleus sp.]|nr:di-trans,poly-cis-decaprenylcistransferase [Methanoculleus sp.]